MLHSILMRLAGRRPTMLYLVASGALLLLPVMAALQYRWIGQVSDAERERRERTLKQATSQVAQDLDVELFKAFVGLQVDGEALRSDDWSGYAERADAWRAAASSPALVREVLLADRLGPRLRLRRWDHAARRFVAAEWSSDLHILRSRFEKEAAAWDRNPPDAPSRLPDLLTETDDAIVAPVAPVPQHEREHRTTFTPVFGYTIVRLDAAFIRDEFLPALVERHFRQGTGDEYRVAVVSRRDPARVIYAANPDDVEDLVARHDAEADLFGLRPDQFQLLRQADRSLRGFGPASGERRPNLFFSLMVRRGQPHDGVGRGGARVPGEMGKAFDDLQRWKLVARHRAGSLEAAVGAARTRNTALSFGVLLLMAVTVGVLARTARRAERLARQQIEFVAAVSHELRTPVSVIGAAAENLADGLVADPARVKQYGTRIQTESRRLGDTVERVLLYAGIEAGHAVGHRTPLSVGTLIGEAVTASQDTLSGAGVTVEVKVPDGLPPVLVDVPALRSCLANLIANAVKYGGTSRWIGVTASIANSRKGREVRVAVTDKGMGISSAELPHIFEPFFRGADARSRQINGNGLGLSIVKGIVDAHGGCVTVQSTPGVGSTFVLHLPAYEGEASPIAQARPHTAPQPST
jgi:signal transduction histidine kinase